MHPAFQCSTLARELGVQAMGSAPTVKTWFLIEVPQAVEEFWEREFAGIDHQHLSAYPQSRWLLIKQREGMRDRSGCLLRRYTNCSRACTH